MELISGKNIYECDFEKAKKRIILEKLVEALQKLHSKENVPVDYFSMYEAYYGKTLDRLSKIQNMLPLADERVITINGRKCRNVFFHLGELEKQVESLKCSHFSFIHGDCTFSNLMVRDNGDPVLIDPRGYFGFTELYGDENYDWAKLYYSIVGNYDRFNLKDFNLDIGGHSIYSEYTENSKPQLDDAEVNLSIKSNNWEDMEKDFFELTGANEYEIKLLHAIIWLSLTTYAWQDYDSICGAFYNGLYYLEEVL
jgi:thiamine kinase-like enzyme